VYVALIKQTVVKRRRSECSTHSNALDDVKVLNTTNPPSLTSSFTIFEKADLIIFISDNTDLWLTDASYSGFGTDLDVITGKFYQLVLFRR
jgi:hypothetical protein